MTFSKGKRIDDETSKRIVELAAGIGCREGVSALTVTRLCHELNCDRRVIYNRFRDIEEINMIVARRCNEELMAKARSAVDSCNSFHDNFVAFIKAAFGYIYEKNANFQYYAALYSINDSSIINGFLQGIMRMIEDGKASGDVRPETDSRKAAVNIWVIMTGISGMLAANRDYKYQDGLYAMLYGVEAVASYMKA